jgi:hypothetical protein
MQRDTYSSGTKSTSNLVLYIVILLVYIIVSIRSSTNSIRVVVTGCGSFKLRLGKFKISFQTTAAAVKTRKLLFALSCWRDHDAVPDSQNQNVSGGSIGATGRRRFCGKLPTSSWNEFRGGVVVCSRSEFRRTHGENKVVQWDEYVHDVTWQRCSAN